MILGEVRMDDWVDWRLANGSHCEVCPLRGQRKVGTDGPVDAAVVLIGEAPGADEEAYLQGRIKYGKPFQGRSGWALKAKLLAPAQLVDTETTEDGWIKPTKLKCFIMNTIMCRPPGNKINSPEGKKAVACCSNSARALLQELERTNSTRCYVPLGGTALELLTGQDSIGQYRGRVLKFDETALQPMPEPQIWKIALRGVKPPPEALPHLKVVNALLLKQRAALKPEAMAKVAAMREKALMKEMLTLAAPHLKVVTACLLKQRKAWSQHSTSCS